jgi:hypothetical protein
MNMGSIVPLGSVVLENLVVLLFAALSSKKIDLNLQSFRKFETAGKMQMIMDAFLNSKVGCVEIPLGSIEVHAFKHLAFLCLTEYPFR